jgi:formylglycine-generating enzyme required for sulfatase activity
MADQDDQAKPVSLFYSYSHQDEDLQRKLEIQMAVLRRAGTIAEWHDRKLEPGDDWKGQIDRHLTSADIVLLLVSPDFIASDYCWGEEMTKALERHCRGEARVIPVILRHCHWQRTPLGSLQAVPKEGKPITSWPDPDEALVDVVAAIARSVQAARRETSDGQSLASTHIGARSERNPGTVFRDIETPWCPELVMIPAGSFVMGSPEKESRRSPDEGPQRKVRFAQPFALGKYPVTFEEYDHFCAENGRTKPPDQGWGRSRRPAINVSWEDAQAYCQWLGWQAGQPYRLPSEAEWEYACRAGTPTPYWTGETISTKQANYNGAGHEGEYRGQTTPVDTFQANPWGLHDMHGNVWEWCKDGWNDTYGGAPSDGSAWVPKDNCHWLVVRAAPGTTNRGFCAPRTATVSNASAGASV